ncbi:uncharacterized protein TNCV_3269051 [Trichonephila clavipes]|nr:uncharacterized protein TNCV_3269051 [Trichonephila clavipes]
MALSGSLPQINLGVQGKEMGLWSRKNISRMLIGGTNESNCPRLTWEQDILVLKPSTCLHNGNVVDDWMGLDKRNTWFKSQVRDSNRSQDIVNLNKFKKFKTFKNYERNSPMSTYEIITGRTDREKSNEPGPNELIIGLITKSVQTKVSEKLRRRRTISLTSSDITTQRKAKVFKHGRHSAIVLHSTPDRDDPAQTKIPPSSGK